MTRVFTTICILTLLGAFTACKDKATNGANNTVTSNLPIVEIVATHAFDTRTQIIALTYVPNNVAPWLGRIILLDENRHLFSTDIEGRTPLVINPSTYLDIAGLFRKNAAGVFLAINDNNTLEAFIQSDDAGNFMSLPIRGKALKIQQFCKSEHPLAETLKILSTKGKSVDLAISIHDNVLEYAETASTKSDKHHICQKQDEGISTISLQFSNVQTSDKRFMGKADGDFALYQTHISPQKLYRIQINNGLSIQGMNKVHYINATTANYGGGAFKDGVISLIDLNEKRIVFISHEYAGRQIAGADNSQ